MTQADKNFIETCKEILEHGYSSEGTNVRTRWEDGAEANYVSIVGVTNKYDVGKEFPMITLRNNTNTVKKIYKTQYIPIPKRGYKTPFITKKLIHYNLIIDAQNVNIQILLIME